MATYAELQAQYEALLIERANLTALYDSLPIDSPRRAEILAQIQQVNAKIREVLLAQDDLLDPPASAGNNVVNAQIAQDDNASPANPRPPPLELNGSGRVVNRPTTTSASNAIITPTLDNGGGTTGTDAPTRTGPQIQGIDSRDGILAVPPLAVNTTPEGRADLGEIVVTASRPGAFANGDPAKNATRTEIDALFSSQPTIAPQPNILDQYSSYTYSASVYMMDVESYSRFLQSNNKTIQGMALLFQSGGAPMSSGEAVSYDEFGTQIITQIPGRNPFFNLDYYIDNIEISTLACGRGTGSPHNATDLKFTVTEPNGITLIDNLNNAVLNYIYKGDVRAKTNGTDRQGPWGAQNYLLALRFYGYDSDGNLVKGGQNTSTASSGQTQAFVEKFIAFQIKNLTFKIKDKAVEYQWECATPGTLMNLGQARGTIPYNVQIQAGTVRDALQGKLVYATNPDTTEGRTVESTTAPLKAGSAPTNKNTVTQGLFAALNEYQALLVKNNIYTYPDIYEVEFAAEAIANAKITPSGGIDKRKTGMTQSTNPANSLLSGKQSMDSASNSQGVVAGTQVVQLLDMILRNSTYINDQATTIIAPDGTRTPNGPAGKNLAWYKINVESKPYGDIDPLRNDYPYKLKYIITPYAVAGVDSPYFTTPKFRGVHKSYPYWFTGENVSVIDYQVNYNQLYTRVLSGEATTDTRTSNYQSIVKRAFSPFSGQSNKGGNGYQNEPAANASDYLYSPTDLAQVSMTIVGDPAWIYQGEMSSGISAQPFNPNAFLSDGTINVDSGQVYFEVQFNTPRDYNLQTGTVEYDQASRINTIGSTQASSRQSFVYLAKQTISNFRRGGFTQQLIGDLFIFDNLTPEQQQAAQDKKEINKNNQAVAPAARPGRTIDDQRALQTGVKPSIGAGMTVPQSPVAIGTQQILKPVTQSDAPTLSQLQSSQAYIAARRAGQTPAQALDTARAAFTAGTAGSSEPPVKIVKDQNPG